MEQVLTIIGEAKHGMWRFHESGFIREYKVDGEKGLLNGKDPNQWHNLTDEEQSIVNNSYQPTNTGKAGYIFPDNKTNADDELHFIDLSIYHGKYNGKYEDHVPIDLPAWYCSFSGIDFPFVSDLWKFAVEQKMANVIGDLGKRAGNNITSKLSLKL